MKGLLVKDFIMIKKHSVMLFMVDLLFLAISLVQGSMYFAYYSMALVSMLPITMIAYDESFKWNKYELILPVGRNTIVLEKYILSLIFVIPFVLVESVLLFFICGVDSSDLFSLISLLFFCGTVIPALVLPILFRFGYLKGRIINLILIAVLTTLVNVVNYKNISGGSMIDGAFAPQKNAFLLAVAAVILLIVSYLLSAKFYKNREL